MSTMDDCSRENAYISPPHHTKSRKESTAIENSHNSLFYSIICMSVCFFFQVESHVFTHSSVPDTDGIKLKYLIERKFE